MSEQLSVVIITKNEQENIARCLTSVQWADEIVVLDNGSTDRTPEICHHFNCKFIETKWLGFGLTKKLAVDSAVHDWIFSIDSDEQVSEELKLSIQNILKKPDYNGYRIKRISFYLGKKINHCGWERDYPLRLFNRTVGNFNEKPVHESVVIPGRIGKIEAPLFHHSYPTIASHIIKMNRYAELAAQESFQKGKSSTVLSAIFRGLFKFIKMYFLQRGFLDGRVGFILCCNSAFGVYLKYIKLWEKN